MVLKRVGILGVLVAVWAAGVIPGLAWAQGSADSGGSPAVFFPEKIFEFAPVLEGVNVLHDFTVSNTGTAPLLINNVHTG